MWPVNFARKASLSFSVLVTAGANVTLTFIETRFTGHEKAREGLRRFQKQAAFGKNREHLLFSSDSDESHSAYKKEGRGVGVSPKRKKKRKDNIIHHTPNMSRAFQSTTTAPV